MVYLLKTNKFKYLISHFFLVVEQTVIKNLLSIPPFKNMRGSIKEKNLINAHLKTVIKHLHR